MAEYGNCTEDRGRPEQAQGGCVPDQFIADVSRMIGPFEDDRIGGVGGQIGNAGPRRQPHGHTLLEAEPGLVNQLLADVDILEELELAGRSDVEKSDENPHHVQLDRRIEPDRHCVILGVAPAATDENHRVAHLDADATRCDRRQSDLGRAERVRKASAHEACRRLTAPRPLCPCEIDLACACRTRVARFQTEVRAIFGTDRDELLEHDGHVLHRGFGEDPFARRSGADTRLVAEEEQIRGVDVANEPLVGSLDAIGGPEHRGCDTADDAEQHGEDGRTRPHARDRRPHRQPEREPTHGTTVNDAARSHNQVNTCSADVLAPPRIARVPTVWLAPPWDTGSRPRFIARKSVR